MLKNTTEYDIPALPSSFNLTDGHVYRNWSPQEEKIIAKASEFLETSTRQMLPELEKEYVTQFLTLGRQTIDFRSHTYLQCTAASLAIEIIANYLRLNNLTLSLIEPCIDNFPDIFVRHNIPLKPFPDEYLESESFASFLETVDTDAICLVSPNNPTGKTITNDNFVLLLDFCKRKNKLLILDCCFRFYLPQECIVDHYGLLKGSGIDYLIIEDTSKTWSTLELKAPFLAVSNSIYQPIYDIYTDMVFHVSPFVITLMTEFIKGSIDDKLEYVKQIAQINRETLYENIEGTVLTNAGRPHMSIAWLKIKGMTSFRVKQILDENSVNVLPGDFFYWSDRTKGEHFIRVALIRTPHVFASAAKIIGDTLKPLV
jgi:aspartate/methionine/tyrosine aminotransferase